MLVPYYTYYFDQGIDYRGIGCVGFLSWWEDEADDFFEFAVGSILGLVVAAVEVGP